MTAELSSLIEQALGTLREYVERVGYHEAAGLGSTEHAEECRHCAALAALDSLASLVAELDRHRDAAFKEAERYREAAVLAEQLQRQAEGRIAELEQALAECIRANLATGEAYRNSPDEQAAYRAASELLARSVSAGHAGEQE